MLGVVATIKVKAGMEKEFEAVAKELVAKVNAGEPAEAYALHRTGRGHLRLMARYGTRRRGNHRAPTLHGLGKKRGE